MGVRGAVGGRPHVSLGPRRAVGAQPRLPVARSVARPEGRGARPGQGPRVEAGGLVARGPESLRDPRSRGQRLGMDRDPARKSAHHERRLVSRAGHRRARLQPAARRSRSHPPRRGLPLRERPSVSPGDVPADRELILRARQGDGDAFGLLVVRHQDRIYAAVLRFCGDAEDAREIVQRAFINAWRRLDSFKGDAAFSTWMYRIAFNESVSFRREGGRRRPVPMPETGADPADDRRPGDRLDSEESRAQVQQALDRLDPEERKILILKELEDRSYDEIAEILEIPKGTVRSRLFRARAALREKLERLLKSAEPGPLETRPRTGGNWCPAGSTRGCS